MQLLTRLSLFSEVVRYLLSSSPVSFAAFLLARLEAAPDMPGRPTRLMFILLAGLRQHAYDVVLRVLKDYREEIEWNAMSRGPVRQLFETAIIYGQPPVARAILAEIRKRDDSRPDELADLESLLAWEEGSLTDEGVLDLGRTYFATFPGHDSWLKGRVSVKAKRQREAIGYFEQCLAEAPAGAHDLRRDAAENLARLKQQTD